VDGGSLAPGRVPALLALEIAPSLWLHPEDGALIELIRRMW
jgi:hypothetical protein